MITYARKSKKYVPKKSIFVTHQTFQRLSRLKHVKETIFGVFYFKYIFHSIFWSHVCIGFKTKNKYDISRCCKIWHAVHFSLVTIFCWKMIRKEEQSRKPVKFIMRLTKKCRTHARTSHACIKLLFARRYVRRNLIY